LITRVKADIKSKKLLTGSGYYLYTDGKKLKKEILIKKIETDSSRLVTTGLARVGDTTAFTLSRAFNFKGDVLLDASQPFLRFSGQASLPLAKHCEGMKDIWIMSDTMADPKGVTISIREPIISGGGDKVKAAIMMPKTAGRFYPAFLQPAASADIPVLAAKGGLIYTDGAYVIAPAPVLKNRSLPGNILQLDSATCTVKGIGKIDLNYQFVPTFSVKLAGEFNVGLKEGTQGIKGLMLLDHPLIKAASEILIKAFEEAQLPQASITNDMYQKPLADLLGSKTAENLRTELQFKDKKVNDAIKTATLMTGFDFKWESNTMSFNSIGPVGLIVLEGKPINKIVRVYAQIMKRVNQNEDNMKVLFWLGETNYYYFEFGRGSVMTWASTNIAFNTKISEEADAFNKKSDKENPDSKWKAFKMSSAPVNEALKFKSEMDAKSL